MRDQHPVDVLAAALSDGPKGLVCAYLFGSHARGGALSGSDVDVAVVFEVRSHNEYFDLVPHLQRYRRTNGGRAA